MIYRLLMVLALLLPSVVSAAVLQSVEWEELAASPWSYTGGSPAIDCSITPSPSGGCALKFTYSAGDYPSSMSGGRANVTFGSQNELWTGAWHRYSSNFIWNGNGTKRNFVILQDGGQYNYTGNMATGWKGNPTAPAIVASNQIVWGTTTQDFTCAYTAVKDTWVWMEEHLIINTPGQADGVFEQYVNGVRVCRFTNVPYRDSSVSTGWGSFVHTAEWGGGGGSIPTMYWYVDHTVISTTPIGMPGGTPPPADTTVPSVPTLTATVSGSSQINLSWTASTDTGGSGLAGYNLRFCTGAACTPTTALISIAQPTLTHTHNGLTASTVYGYSINAYDNAGNQSAYGATQYATTSAAGALGTITFDAVANSPDNESANTTSWSHTVGAGDNRYLLVCLQSRGVVAGTVLATSLTRNGVGLTKIRSESYANGGVYMQTELWGQVAPTVGAGTIVATWAGVPQEYGVGTSTSYLGVDQTTPIEAHAGGTGDGVTASAVVTTLTANAWLSDCVIGRDDAGMTVGAGQAVRTDRLVGTVELTNDGAGVSTVNGKASPGAETMDWTQVSAGWSISAVALKPAAAGVSPSITGASADATGANLTFGATTPTTVRVQTNVDSTLYTVATIEGGRTSVGSETFTRADNTDLGTEWTTQVSPWSLATNAAQASGVNDVMVETHSGVLPSDQWSQVTLAAFGGTVDTFAGPMTRNVQNGDTNYACVAARVSGVQGARIVKRIAGVSTNLVTDETTTWAANDLIRLESEGSTHRCYKNGTLMLTATDTTITGGYAGMWGYIAAGGTASNVRLDSFLSGGMTPLDTTGRFDRVWTPDLTSATFYARDAAGNENTTAGAFQTVSLSGIVQQDTTAPTLSNGQPASTLPQGTTATDLTALASETVVCRYSTTDEAYDAMDAANQMTVINRTCSVNLTGLTNGSSTVYYIAAKDLALSPNETASRLAVTVAVAAAPAADTTAPSIPLNFLCTALSQTQASCSWDQSTDAVGVAGYYLYLCGGTGCSSFSQVGTILSSTTTIVDLVGSTDYTMKVKAVDTSTNLSDYSNASTITTSATVDFEPPSTMTGLTIIPYVNSVALSWAQGYDNISPTTAVIERCAGDACSNFLPVLNVPLVTSFVQDGLTAGTVYRFRGRHADQAGNMSASYSNIVEITTLTDGLARPRLSSVGTDSVPREQVSATSRLPR